MTEYKELVGSGRTGDAVINSQGVAKGFSNVSQYWLPQTLTFENAIAQLQSEKRNGRDFTSSWSDWFCVIENGKFALKSPDGEFFYPSDFALGKLADWCCVPSFFLKKTFSDEFKADSTDLEQLVDMLNYRKKREHKKNNNEDRKLKFRVNGDELRTILTEDYAYIDNIWYLKVLERIIPGGRVSHLRGNCDTMYGNILIPDSIRYDTDSDYGGMSSFRNSEIGEAAIWNRPSLFRAICMNGCIWDETKGVEFKQVHKGRGGYIDLQATANGIAQCITKQIKLIPEIMERFLKLREYQVPNDIKIRQVVAEIVESNKLTGVQGREIIHQFATFEKDSKNAFGIVNAVTRTGQLYTPDVCEDFDRLGGKLAKANWDAIYARANNFSFEKASELLGI